MSKKRIFVLSVDALVTEDLDYLRTLPHMGEFLSHASGCESIRTVYPSVTYPAHVAMYTGCYPDRSGVFNNAPFSTFQGDLDWVWDRKFIRCDDIFSAAKRGGYTTACGFWPVTGSHPAIDYNMPEYWLHHPGETLRGSFLSMGSSEEIVEMMEKNDKYLPKNYKLGGMANVAEQPYFDDFLIHMTCEMIEKYQPEVLLIHESIIDDYRHGNGIFHEKVFEGLRQVDAWWGQLMDAFKRAGVYEDTDFFLTSDHGQQDVIRRIKLNAILADRGLIDVDADGNVTDYRVYTLSAGLSTHVYLKDPNDKALYEDTYKMLCQMAEDGLYGFKTVYTREETAAQFHLDGDFDFVLESDGYTGFSDSVQRPFTASYEKKNYRLGRASHGYLPDDGPQPVFMCKGPHIRPDVLLPRHDIVDEAPTYAALLGVELKDAQGTALTELLK